MFLDICFLSKLRLHAMYTVPQEQVLCSRPGTDRCLSTQLSLERTGSGFISRSDSRTYGVCLRFMWSRPSANQLSIAHQYGLQAND